jgi:hypothetical protein
MEGMATLTIVVSSKPMKIATNMTPAASHRLGFGFGSGSGEEAVDEPMSERGCCVLDLTCRAGRT